MRNELYDRFTDGTKESERWTNNSQMAEYYKGLPGAINTPLEITEIKQKAHLFDVDSYKMGFADGVKFTEDKHER